METPYLDKIIILLENEIKKKEEKPIIEWLRLRANVAELKMIKLIVNKSK